MNKICLIYIVIIFLFLSPYFDSKSQITSFHFDHLTKNNGLASNRINCIYQDSTGFIWFGTEEGLQKYDGYSFETFQYEPTDTFTISNNRINCISKDIIKDNFWIGTAKGLNYFDRKSYSFVRYRNITELNGLPGNQIFTLLSDKHKKLWIGASAGLYKFDLVTRKLKNYNRQANVNREFINKAVLSIYEDKEGNIWIGTKSGLFKYDSPTDYLIKFGRILIDKEIRFIHEDKTGNFWVGTNTDGIYRFKDGFSEDNFINYRMENSFLMNNRAYCIAEENTGNLFIGIRDGGLIYYDFRTNGFTSITPDIRDENSLNSKALLSIYKDNSGIIWMGTYSSGVNIIDNHRKKFELYTLGFNEKSLFNKNIRALFEDYEGNIWIGTKDGGGLSKFNKKTKSFEHFKPNPNNPSSISDDYVFSINEIDERFLLVGTFRKGLEILDKKTGRFEHFIEGNSPNNPGNSRIYIIYKDKDRVIWLGTGTHIEKFDPATRKFTKCAEVSRANCFLEKDSDSFWIGTTNDGLLRYNKKNGKLTDCNNASLDSISLVTYGISSLVKDKNNILWIGLYGGGFYAYDSTGNKKRKYTTKQGLSSNKICGMLVDGKNNLWISTTNGISKFNPDNEKFINYSVQDGLQGIEFEEFVALKTRDGEMLFGGNNGFNLFDPNSIKSNPVPPTVIISGFKIFNKPVEIGGENSPLEMHISKTNKLILKHDYSVITFEFVALNYTSPEKVKYAYKLEGFEKDWNYVGSARSATYTNLEAGNYIFRVKASNNDGIWNETGTSIKIKVLPPYWKTIWAYLIYAIILFLLLNALRQYAIFRTKAKNELLRERLEHEKMNEVNQMKLRFFTNISHEFRTPLTLILGPIQSLIDANRSEDNKWTLLTIRKNASILLNLVNQLMDLRKIDTGNMRLKSGKGDIMNLVEEIAQSFDTHARERSIKFIVEKEPEKFEMWFDNEKLEKIILNLIANAFKFTPDFGEISLIAKVIANKENKYLIDNKPTPNIFELKVKDSGIGIPEDAIQEIFTRFYQVKKSKSAYIEGTGIGLSLVKDLITLMNGEIFVESTEKIGSCFTICIPVDENYRERNQKDENPETEAKPDSGVFKRMLKSTFDVIQTRETEMPKTSLSGSAPLILLVDDNLDIRNYIIKSLQHKYWFEQATNGSEGLDIAIELQPDIIISDVLMPEMDGMEFCKRLKTEIQTSHIPIILLTALTSLEYEIEGIETGADAYISKPFSMDLLEVHIKSLIESRKKLRERFELDICLQPKEITINSRDKDFLEKAMEIIEKHMSDPDFEVSLFANEMGISRTVLYRKLKAVTGMTINEYINTVRLKRSLQLLQQHELSVSEIAYEVGFSSPKYFSTCFRKQFHKTPSEYASNL